jgi:hypothetical protein
MNVDLSSEDPMFKGIESTEAWPRDYDVPALVLGTTDEIKFIESMLTFRLEMTHIVAELDDAPEWVKKGSEKKSEHVSDMLNRLLDLKNGGGEDFHFDCPAELAEMYFTLAQYDAYCEIKQTDDGRQAVLMDLVDVLADYYWRDREALMKTLSDTRTQWKVKFANNPKITPGD